MLIFSGKQGGHSYEIILHAVLPLLLATVILFSSAVSIAGAVSLKSGGELAAVGGENDVFVLAGTKSFLSTGWAPDPESYVMNKGEGGIWSITVPDVAAIDDTIYSVKVVQFVDGDPNNATWHGMDGGDLNYDFMLSDSCDVTVTYDPETAEITVSGSNVIPPVYELSCIAAAGRGNGSFLNGVNWNPSEESNYMKEVSDGVYETTFEDCDTNTEYEVKFASNGEWDINWGAVKDADAPEFGVAIECGYNGENIKFTAEADEDTVDITLRLDISNWDTMKKTGATYTIILDGEEYAQDPTSAPAGSTKYYIAGSFNGWKIENDNEMFRNTSANGFEYYLGRTFDYNDQFKVVSYNTSIQGGSMTWYPDGMGNNYGENGEITADGSCTIYFRPDGDGGDDWFYGCIYAAADEEDNPTEVPTEEPTGEPEEPTEAPTEEPAEGILLGDVDGDGLVTVFDATAIQRYLANLPTESFNEEAADVDGDGEVSILDATYIQRFVADFDDGYPIGKAIS